MKNGIFRLLTALIAVVAVILISGCGPSVSSDITVTSSVVLGHTHQITVAAADIKSPPSGPKVITSTSAGTPSHTHIVTLTQPDSIDIGNGRPVTKTSSTEQGHSHDFSILKTGQTGGGGGY